MASTVSRMGIAISILSPANQVILDELVKATIGLQKRADFSDLVGRWKPDPGFDKIIDSQRQIDREKWQ